MPKGITAEDMLENLKQQLDSGEEEKSYTHPYYSESFGRDAKKIFDELEASKARITIHARDVSIHTIRAQFYQGRKYLVDHLDTPEGYYAKLAPRVKLITYDSYIEFHIRSAPKSFIQNIQIEEGWREDLLCFLENAAPGEKFHRHLNFTEKDIAYVNNLLAGLTKEDGSTVFFGDINENQIMLVRDTI